MRVQRMGGSEHWRGQGTDLLGSRATRGAVRLHLTESGSLFEFELGGSVTAIQVHRRIVALFEASVISRRLHHTAAMLLS